MTLMDENAKRELERRLRGVTDSRGRLRFELDGPSGAARSGSIPGNPFMRLLPARPSDAAGLRQVLLPARDMGPLELRPLSLSQDGPEISPDVTAPIEVSPPVDGQKPLSSTITVQKGDGFDRIASRVAGAGATPEEVRQLSQQLADYNGIQDLRNLRPGQVLGMPPADWKVGKETSQRFADEDARYQAERSALQPEPETQSYSDELFQRRQSMAQALRSARAEGRFEDIEGETRWGSGLSPSHRKIVEQADAYPAAPGTKEWNTLRAANWKVRGSDIFEFKDQWVAGHRDAILAAAKEYNLPSGLVAGVAYTEVGGDPPVFDDLGFLANPLIGKPQDQTSFGDMSVQTRRIGQSLDYGLAASPQQVQSMIRDARNPSRGIFIAAKHLSDLRDLDFPGTNGQQMTAEQIEITAARYNRGPQFSIDQIRSNLDYGKDITKRWDHLQSLLKPVK